MHIRADDLKRKMGEMRASNHDPKDVVHLELPCEADEQWCEAFLTESADHLGSRVQLLSDAEGSQDADRRDAAPAL